MCSGVEQLVNIIKLTTCPTIYRVKRTGLGPLLQVRSALHPLLVGG